MKKVAMAVAAVLLLVSAAGAAGGKTAFVDTQMVFEKTKLGQKYQGIIREYYESRKKVLDQDYEEIQKAQEDYKKQSSMLNEKARKEKEEALSKKINEFEKKRSEYGNEIDRKQNELYRDFNQAMTEVLKDLAKKEKVSMILNKAIDILGKSEVPSVLYADDDLNFTDRVIAEMDKKQEQKGSK